MELLIHLLLLFGVSPLLPGLIAKTKAVVAGRRGAPVLQPYYDLAKLLRKQMVISRTTTWIFLTGPVTGLVVPVVAALLIPFGEIPAPVSFSGDLILFVYLFGLARFFTVLAALDTGSSFEGMGAAREVTFACLVEPTILFCFMVLVRISGGLSLGGLFSNLLPAWQTAAPSLGLVLVCLLVVLLAENCRVPFDDPNTHLELTMIHEVMVLDHSGPALALIEYGAAMKLFVIGALLVPLALPFSLGNLPADTALFLTGMLLLAVLIGLIESAMARLRLLKVPQLLVGTTLLSLFALILLLR